VVEHGPVVLPPRAFEPGVVLDAVPELLQALFGLDPRALDIGREH
jgi:hypothetical protein